MTYQVNDGKWGFIWFHQLQHDFQLKLHLASCPFQIPEAGINESQQVVMGIHTVKLGAVAGSYQPVSAEAEDQRLRATIHQHQTTTLTLTNLSAPSYGSLSDFSDASGAESGRHRSLCKAHRHNNKLTPMKIPQGSLGNS